MTKEECIEKQEDFMPVEIYGTKIYATPTGKILTWNGKSYIERQWRYNSDGYPVVSVVGQTDEGKKIYRSVGVHILVARAWVANPLDKPEVNHLDFDRKNPMAYNLEWVTHQENIYYSYKAGHYKGKFGEDNPNFGNNTLHERYLKDKQFSVEKQSRPRGKNGRAKKCYLTWMIDWATPKRFDCQRDAVDWLIKCNIIEEDCNKETVIKNLKRQYGYRGWYLEQI